MWHGIFSINRATTESEDVEILAFHLQPFCLILRFIPRIVFNGAKDDGKGTNSFTLYISRVSSMFESSARKKTVFLWA